MTEHPIKQLRNVKLESTPPDGLKAKVFERLRSDGSLAPGRRHHSPLALCMGFGAGVVATLSILFFLDVSAPAEPVASATHALLLYDTAAIADHSPRSLAKEYGEWAQSLAQRGALITAQELGAEERWVGADAESRSFPTPTGVFLVSASSLAEAIDLTEQSPHVRHGGRIQVRPIIAHQ